MADKSSQARLESRNVVQLAPLRADATNHSPPTIQKSARRWFVVVALAVLGMVAIYAAIQWRLGPKIPTYVVDKGNLLQTIVASGRVETPLRVDIGAQITGTVAAIPVSEGQTVTAGQLLIALEDSEARAAVAAARAAVAQAQTRLKQIHEVLLPAAQQTLRRAQATLLNSSKQFERMKELKSNGVVTQSDFDTAQMNLETAESDVQSAKLQVATNSEQGSDYLVAKTELQQARANLDAAEAKLRYTTIKAPVNGTLIDRAVEQGDVVQPGKALMVLSPAGQTQLVVQIDEKNLADLHIGQRALASADAYPDQQFSAGVVYINPAVDAERGSVEVKLKVLEAPAYLRQDMTVSVDIEVARRSNALILAADAIHDGTSPSPWVIKITDGRATRQPVKIGARGAGKVEILEGLQMGERVVPATSTAIVDGSRARAVSMSTKTPKTK